MKSLFSLSLEELEANNELPEVHYGSANDKPLNWRKAKADDVPDDDSELDETPPDTIALLGFDPSELE